MSIFEKSLAKTLLATVALTAGYSALASDNLKKPLENTSPTVECNTCYTSTQFKNAAIDHYNEYYRKPGTNKTTRYAVVNESSQKAVYLDVVHFYNFEPEFGFTMENVFAGTLTPTNEQSDAYRYNVLMERSKPTINVDASFDYLNTRSWSSPNSGDFITAGVRAFIFSNNIQIDGNLGIYLRGNNLLRVRTKDGYELDVMYKDSPDLNAYVVFKDSLTRNGVEVIDVEVNGDEVKAEEVDPNSPNAPVPPPSLGGGGSSGTGDSSIGSVISISLPSGGSDDGGCVTNSRGEITGCWDA